MKIFTDRERLDWLEGCDHAPLVLERLEALKVQYLEANEGDDLCTVCEAIDALIVKEEEKDRSAIVVKGEEA